jgi:hypothetical protein
LDTAADSAIDVLARFERTGMTPYRFRWNQTVFRVAQVTGRWEDREGQFRRFYYGVITDTGDFFELRLDQKDLRWVLASAAIEA